MPCPIIEIFCFRIGDFLGLGENCRIFGQVAFSNAPAGSAGGIDRDEIGSGNDLIRGNKKTDVQMQLRLKF